jgi:hypothetical protein
VAGRANIIGLCVFLAAAGLGIGVLVLRLRQRDTPALQALAKLFGTTVDGGAVTGQYQGFPVRVGNYNVKRGSLGRVDLTVATGDVKLDVLRRAHLDDRTRSGLDPREVEVDVGDPELSKAYLVVGTSADVVRALLVPAVRRQILDARIPILHVGDGTITVRGLPLIEEETEARMLLDLEVGLARALPGR